MVTGNDITTANQSSCPSLAASFGKHWELGMGIQKVGKQSLLLNLVSSKEEKAELCRTLPVLITGGEGGPCDTCGNLWPGEVGCFNCSFCSGQRGTQEPGSDSGPATLVLVAILSHRADTPLPLSRSHPAAQNVILSPSDRQTAHPHPGSRKINSLVSQLTSLHPIFL